MSETAQAYYRDYWVGVPENREKRRYYERLYDHLKKRLQIEPDWKVLDVAGGTGQLMRYLGIRGAHILDISESGLKEAARQGFQAIAGDVEARFPISESTYDAAFLFEVLEHLHRPCKTLTEIHNVLKPGGVLYVGQPNMRADGTHHVRRYYQGPLLNDLRNCGFKIEWVDYVPAYTMREAILSDIRKNRSWARKTIQCANLMLSLLPWKARYAMAKAVPDRFCLIFVVKAVRN